VNREQELAFEAFVAVSAQRLLSVAYLICGDLGEAEDLLQGALERTARHWTRLAGEPEAYARVVLANLATDRWRRRRSRPTEIAADEMEFAAQTNAALGTGDHADSVAIRLDLIVLLNSLPRRQRAVLVLRYFCDQSEAETARALGISLGTVKSTTSRALARLRKTADLVDTGPCRAPGKEIAP
jgi:RNA polymerase sigma-70 factor (sigma-E family)